MAGYLYNPLLKEGFQKKQDIPEPPQIEIDDALSDTSENAVQNRVITTELNRMKQDTTKKVSKFFTSIEELEIGEIGEYQGETNEDFTRGYFYERRNSQPIEYEDVTIPAGSQRIIYTNKFDSTQKIVYAIERISLEKNTPIKYSQSSHLIVVNESFKTKCLNDFYTWLQNSPSVIDDNANGLAYSVSYSLSSIYREHFRTNGTLLGIKNFYNFLQTVYVESGFRMTMNDPGNIGRIDDFVSLMTIPLRYDASYGHTTYDTELRWVIFSELEKYNWNIEDYIQLMYPVEAVTDAWYYDKTRDVLFESPYYIARCIDNQYVFVANTASAQYTTSIYHTIDESGDLERYIDVNHRLCVFNSTPVSGSDYWAEALDLDLYFNYEASFDFTTSAITIRRRIHHYDEYGFPIVETSAARRIDTQPSTDPSQFATAAQGAKADTALQSVTHGTDGDYITTTVGTKEDNAQTVGVSAKVQDITTADSAHKGLAEASNVKAYITASTASTSQGAKADTALQSIAHGTDGDYITTTVGTKEDNAQTVGVSAKVQDITTADSTHKGLAEASNTKSYIDKQIYDISQNFQFYGVQWDTASPSPECTRIGNMSLHAELPVQNGIIGGLLADDLTFTPFADQSDWSGETLNGSAGQVMVRIPKHYVKFETHGTINKVLMSEYPLPGFTEVPLMYVSAFKAALDRTDPAAPKLASVANTTAAYRGGQNTADWDGTYRSLLGKPATNITLTNFRQYARNRAAGSTAWNCHTYQAQRTLYWLYVVEYATLNSQKAYNAAKDANGYMQGGLGIGATDWNSDLWLAYNNHNPLIPCGYMAEYGNRTAVKNHTIYDGDGTAQHTFQVNSYRGIQSPFGDIWDWTDGILVDVQSDAEGGVSTCYVADDPADFSSTDFSHYREVGDTPRTDTYIKGIFFGADGDIVCKTQPGSSTSYYCDNYWGANLPQSGVSLRGVPFGGPAAHGAHCGFLCAHSTHVPAYVTPAIGSRLCAIPPP